MKLKFPDTAIGQKLSDPNFSQQFARAYGLRVPREDCEWLEDNFSFYTQFYFSNGKTLYPPLGYIIQDRFLTGDLGSLTNGESCVLWSYLDKNAPAVRRLFTTQLLEVLYKNEYSGVLSIKSTLSPNDGWPYFIKFVPQTDISIHSLFELYPSDHLTFIDDVMNNKIERMELINGIACTITVSLPPYPFNGSPKPIYLSALAQDWQEARREVKKKIDKLPVNDYQYRLDAGVQGVYLNILQEKGYYP